MTISELTRHSILLTLTLFLSQALLFGSCNAIADDVPDETGLNHRQILFAPTPNTSTLNTTTTDTTEALKCAPDSEFERDRPLMCYQCQSRSGHRESDRESDPCDNDLWRFTRKSERYRLRVKCPRKMGTYCVKVVKSKRGEQITERGCYGEGPVKARDGSMVNLQDGCVTFTQDGYLTITCLCKSHDLCNTAPTGFLNRNRILLLSTILVQLTAIVLFLN